MKHVGSCILKSICLLGLCLVILTGCTEMIVPSQPTGPSYTVTFLINGQVHREQRVEEGDYPTAVPTSLQGIQALGWEDETGTIVDPTARAVTGNVTYKLAFYPMLSRHVPYLFADGQNQLRPDDVLTEKELTAALEAVAAGGAKAYFPELPSGDGAVDGQFVSKILLYFFPKERVQETVASGQAVTRSEFAVIMNTLLQRDTDQAILPADIAMVPVDVTTDREDAVQLLEAALPHTETEDGIGWEEVELPTTFEPGFVNLDGYLYYVKTDHYFLRDDKVGQLRFDTDGRYTSGDAELDALVADVLKKLIRENPDKAGVELLRVVYQYCRDSFTYQTSTGNTYKLGETGWEVDNAKEMLLTGRGNAYDYAAAFWALSRGLGWETAAISGTRLAEKQPHGWCQIRVDGKDYFFDCGWEAESLQQGSAGENADRFMLLRSKASEWDYRWKK